MSDSRVERDSSRPQFQIGSRFVGRYQALNGVTKTYKYRVERCGDWYVALNIDTGTTLTGLQDSLTELYYSIIDCGPDWTFTLDSPD